MKSLLKGTFIFGGNFLFQVQKLSVSAISPWTEEEEPTLLLPAEVAAIFNPTEG